MMKKNLPILFAVLLVSLGISGTYFKPFGKNQEKIKYQKLMEEATQSFRQKNFLQTQSILNQFESIDYRIDSLHLLEKRLNDSISIGKKSLINQAKILINQQNYTQAIKLYTQLTTRYDNSTMSLKLLEKAKVDREDLYVEALQSAKGLMQTRKYSMAKRQIQIARNLWPEDLRWQSLQQEAKSQQNTEAQATLVRDIEQAISKRQFTQARSKLFTLKNEDEIKAKSLEYQLNQALSKAFNEYIKTGTDCLSNNNCTCAKRNLDKAKKLNVDNDIINQAAKVIEKTCSVKVCYSPLVRRRGSNDLKITKIESFNDKTLITLTFNSANKSGRIYPPGHREAFTLEEKRGKMVSQLLEVRGLGSKNKLGELFTEEIRSFTLLFGPLPPKIKEVHLIEGSGNDETMTYWNFIGIDISSCTK